MKLGVIGTGMIATEFLPYLVNMPELEVQAVLSTPRSLEKAKKLCREYHIPCATDRFEKLCDAGVDTVYIAVPNLLHRDYCVRAIEAGLNVIVEKPLASRIEEVRELKALAKDRRRFLFEAITTLYLPAYQKIAEWLPRIGEVKLVQSQFCQFSSRYRAFQRGEIAPVFDPKQAGGAMMDLNLYNLHYVMGLFGVPESADYRPELERGIDTSGVTLLCYPGFSALCTSAKSCGGAGWGLIQGTDGCIRSLGTPNHVGDIVLELYDGTREVFSGTSLEERALPEMRAFARAIQEEDYAFCWQQLERSAAVSEVQTAARRSAGILFPGE